MIYAFRLALIFFYTAVFGSIGTVGCLITRSGRLMVAVGRAWVSCILATCRIRVEASGLEHLPIDQPCVYMSNHQSVFDIAAIIHSLPASWRFVAKRELTWIPFFGWSLALGGNVIIDRRNRAAAVASLAAAAERVRGGVNVIIFPEGTRSKTGELRVLKSGGFYLALQAGVPIVPVSVTGGREIAPRNSFRIESGTIRVHYGKPIPTSDLGVDDRERLKAEVRQAILQGFEENEGAARSV